VVEARWQGGLGRRVATVVVVAGLRGVWRGAGSSDWDPACLALGAWVQYCTVLV